MTQIKDQILDRLLAAVVLALILALAPSVIAGWTHGGLGGAITEMVHAVGVIATDLAGL